MIVPKGDFSMNGGFAWFLVFWACVLIGFLAIGGFFMMRKFLKVLPKADGKSKLDWQNYYIEESRSLWTDESKKMLEQLVSPVPSPFRDIARNTIAARIAQLALDRKAAEITEAHCIEGYILATPKRDHKFLVQFLQDNQIDFSTYRHLLSNS
ncbi:DUF2621 family protein [Gorillibacterium massiliense]|uniref:DUF2621 family protein n=1 Tax=Gorillibacterium massiliense TaxID=1280390 RepID=UPI0004B37BFD|nr:DUF2621 family protein [Gorillibacterium massiliense]